MNQQGEKMSTFSDVDNFVPWTDSRLEYLTYSTVLGVTMFPEEEESVHSYQLLYHILQHELEPRQQLQQWEISRMFTVATKHFRLKLLLISRL